MGTKKKHIDLEKQIAELEKKIVSFRKEKEHYQTLFDSILFGVQETDAKGTIIYANKAQHDSQGYEYGELIGKSMFDLLPTEDEKAELAAYLDYLLQEQPIPTPWIGTDRKKDGSLRDVKVDWNYKRDTDGNVVGFISLITDITEKKKLQKDLHESKWKFQSIFKDSSMAIMYTNENATVTSCNDNANRLFGVPDKTLHCQR